jgi:1-acyl-sn-glycerol-3-phosphate acyltransferase
MFSIPVSRENFSASDFKNVVRAIEAEQRVVVFPEGSIQRTGQVFPGVIRFAERSNQVILPIRFEVRRGQYPPNYPFGFPALTLVIGKPFTIRDLEFDLTGDETKDERYEKLSQWLLTRIDSAAA